MASSIVDRQRVHIMHSEPIIAVGLAGVLAQVPLFDVRMSDSFCGPDGKAVVVCDESRVQSVLSNHPRASVVVIAQTPRAFEIQRVLGLGAFGYVVNHCRVDELHEAVRAAIGGRRFLCRAAAQEVANGYTNEALTSRERDVLGLLSSGRCNKGIASQLHIAIGTVKAHVRSIMSKLQAASRTEAASIAVARGLVRDQAVKETRDIYLAA